MASLDRQIRQVESGLNEAVSKVIGEMAFAAFSAIVLATPVDTGRARGNWQPSVGEPESGELNVQDKSGSSAIGKSRSTFANYSLGPKIWFSNNVPYIQRLNEGHSQQAKVPGFVERAIQEGLSVLDNTGELL